MRRWWIWPVGAVALLVVGVVVGSFFMNEPLRRYDVYDARQDREKNLFQKLYEGVAGGVSEILENFLRDEVATTANIVGPLENPQASIWQVLVNLIQNAFFQAILPGFERELGRAERGTPQRSSRPR